MPSPPTYELRWRRVGPEMAFALLFAGLFTYVSLADASLGPVFRAGLLLCAIGAAASALWLAATPQLRPGELTMGLGPFRRRFRSSKYAEVATHGLHIILIGPHGAQQRVLVSSRFEDPARIRSDVEAWARGEELAVVVPHEPDAAD